MLRSGLVACLATSLVAGLVSSLVAGSSAVSRLLVDAKLFGFESRLDPEGSAGSSRRAFGVLVEVPSARCGCCIHCFSSFFLKRLVALYFHCRRVFALE